MDVEFSNEPLMVESDDEDFVTCSKMSPRKKEFNDLHVLKKTKLKDLKGKGKGQSKVSDVDEFVSSILSVENINANLGTMACAWSKAEEKEQKLDEKGNTKSIVFHRLLQIPDEILMDEILPRLPVKSIFRFKCVSKSWQSHFESDRFMKIQYQNSAKNPRFIFNFNSYSMKECSLQTLLNSKEESDPTKNEAMSGTLVGCSNGVVCCYDPLGLRFSLWNPAIRVRIELPDNGARYMQKCGFDWVESTGAYKVFVVLCFRTVLSKRVYMKRLDKIYSSNTKSWRTIPHGSLSLYSLWVFLRGNLHWVDMRPPQIECLDLEREEFGRIGLPLENAAKVVLGEIGKSLSILIDWEKRLEVWVMKEYGVKDSWFKLLMFPPHISPRIFSCLPFFGEGFNGDIFMIYRCFRVFREGELLACDEENLTVYSPKDNAFSTARNCVDFQSAHLYVESLVSPRRIIDAMPPTPLGEEEEEEEEEGDVMALVKEVEVAGGEEKELGLMG